MSGGGSGLSPREHDELRDVVLAGAQRIRPAGSGRAKFVAAAIALVLVGAVAGVILSNVVRDDGPIAPAPAPELHENGWVAFTAGRERIDAYIVTPGADARSVLAPDGRDEVCPAFSPDGTRLVVGRSGRNSAEEASLVVVDVADDGTASASTTIPLAGVHEAPCAQWSRLGDWVAFGTDLRDDTSAQRFSELRAVNTATREVRTVPALSASDFAWAPDASEIYLADRGRIVVSSLSGQGRRVVDDSGQVRSFDVSPDGRRLAVMRSPQPASDRFDLWVMNADGSDPARLVEDFLGNHGVGPVWSPDGDRIVLQKLCDTFTNESGGEQVCREQHLAVVVTVADGAQTVIDAPITAAPGYTTGRIEWYPWSVTWSPDGTRLLYVAWPQGDVSDEGIVGLLSVPIDDAEAPDLLYAGGDVRAHPGFPWNTAQSWAPARE